MAAENCSVEAAIIENGKSVNGTLTLFADEYVFGSKRKTINWENAECKKGTVMVRSELTILSAKLILKQLIGTHRTLLGMPRVMTTTLVEVVP